MEIILVASPPQKILAWANRPSRTQSGISSRLCFHCQDCFTILHNAPLAKRDIEIILMAFLKKNLIRGNLVILAQKWWVLITLDLFSVFFKILHGKRGQKIHEHFISCFSRKNLIWGNFIFYYFIGCRQNWVRPLLLLDP